MSNKAWMLILPCLGFMGCAHQPTRKPRWDVVINLTVESQVNRMTKTKAGIEIKRITKGQ